VSAQVYYDNASEASVVVPVTFTSAVGVVTDPTSVTCVVTDPTGATVSYTYGGVGPNNTVTRTSSGNYALSLTGITLAGLYTAVWVGTGNAVNQVTPTTVRIVPLSAVGTGMQYWYTGKEELKSRLNIVDSNSDYEIQLAIQAVTNWINVYCGRHFYQVTETRTYCPDNIWELPIDDLVSTPAVAATVQVNLDYNGTGVYSTAWGNPAPPISTGTNYVLKLGTPSGYQDNYNVNAAGFPRPYTQLQALMSGQGQNPAGGGWLPFIWPYTHLDRVQVIGTWGWNVVPPAVAQASLLLCTDVFKSKDAPWGIAGTAETGLMRVQSNPWAVELLHDFINTRRKVGILYSGFAYAEDMREVQLNGKVAAGRVTRIDDADFEAVMQYRWLGWEKKATATRRANGPYACRQYRDETGKNTLLFMHTFLTGWSRTDHINHDGLDNQRHNLRETTVARNEHNSRPRLGTYSQYKGVTWSVKAQKWQTSIRMDGKLNYLGQFHDETEAARVYDEAALRYFGPHAFFNFPTGVLQVFHASAVVG
jgi:hypothetical protein